MRGRDREHDPFAALGEAHGHILQCERGAHVILPFPVGRKVGPEDRILRRVVGGALGCWIVFYELSYSAESLAHSLFPGLVLAALLGIPVLLGGAAGILLAALAIALAATNNFLSAFTNFLLFLLYFMTPWSAINLVDYYWVRREQYRISELFNPRGVYGRVNKSAFVAYLVGVVIQVPFMNSSLYVGPVADWMGGAELAWVLGLVVAGGLYFALSADVRRTHAPHPHDPVAEPAAAAHL